MKWSNDLTDNLPIECFQSSNYHSGRFNYTIEKAFDNHEGSTFYDGFQIDKPTESDWFLIDLKKFYKPSKISIQANDSLALPESLLIYVSQDGKKYDYIDRIDNISSKDKKIQEFKIKQPKFPIRFIKFNFINENKSICEINQIQIFECSNTKYLLKRNNEYFYFNNEVNQIINDDSKDILSLFSKYGSDDLPKEINKITKKLGNTFQILKLNNK